MLLISKPFPAILGAPKYLYLSMYEQRRCALLSVSMKTERGSEFGLILRTPTAWWRLSKKWVAVPPRNIATAAAR